MLDRNKFFFYLLPSILVVFFSCNRISQAEEVSEIEEIQKKVIFVIHGIVRDQGLHELGLSGLEKSSSQLGYQISYQSMDNPSDFNIYLENIYNLNYNVILTVDFTLWENIYQQAILHSDQKYVIIDYTEIENSLNNLLTVGFRSEEGSFLAGYLAAKMSKTGKIGFIGGVKGTIIDMFDYGYEAGAKYANPNIIILNKYSEDFNNPPLGKTIASYMYQNGVDIIFHAAGATGLGIIESAKELNAYNLNNLWVIGVDNDQSPLGPDVVLTSLLKRVDNVIYSILENYREGHFEGGSSLELGLKDQALELVKNSNIPKDLEEELEELTQKIIMGEINIPYNEESFKDLYSS